MSLGIIQHNFNQRNKYFIETWMVNLDQFEKDFYLSNMQGLMKDFT